MSCFSLRSLLSNLKVAQFIKNYLFKIRRRQVDVFETLKEILGIKQQ